MKIKIILFYFLCVNVSIKSSEKPSHPPAIDVIVHVKDETKTTEDNAVEIVNLEQQPGHASDIIDRDKSHKSSPASTRRARKKKKPHASSRANPDADVVTPENTECCHSGCNSDTKTRLLIAGTISSALAFIITLTYHFLNIQQSCK